MKKKWFLIPLLSFILVLVLFRYVFYIGYVPTNSMEPTIMIGDKIFGIRILGELEVGDTDGASITKSRLIGALKHLWRLSKINIDSII